MSTAGDSREDCALGEECGVHYRVNTRHSEDGWFLNYTDYVGEYVIITSARVNSGIAALLFEQMRIHLYDTAILKVGDMSLSDKAQDAYLHGESDETWLAWEVTYDSIEKAMDGHDMVVQAFKNDMLDLKV